MRQKYVAPDHDSVNDTKIFDEEFSEEVKLNKPRYEKEQMVEYRFNQDQKSWLPAIVIDNTFHNVSGHCVYKVYSVMYGYREVHESVLYPMDA